MNNRKGHAAALFEQPQDGLFCSRHRSSWSLGQADHVEVVGDEQLSVIIASRSTSRSFWNRASPRPIRPPKNWPSRALPMAPPSFPAGRPRAAGGWEKNRWRRMAAASSLRVAHGRPLPKREQAIPSSSEGKGLGRTFFSPVGAGLYMSVLLRPEIGSADLDLPAERGRPPPVFIQVRTGGEILRKYKILPGEVASYRDSIFLERAIIGERLRLAIVVQIGGFVKKYRAFSEVSPEIHASGRMLISPHRSVSSRPSG